MQQLSREAESLPVEETAIVALDWMNGRRTPDANQELKGAITGLSLGSDAPKIFRSLVEATAFGSKMINERFISEGMRIDGVIAIGGVARKNPFVMQIVADVLNMPIRVVRSDQTCALGAAMAASVVAGVHRDIPSAQKAMGSGFEKEYYPDKKRAAKYETLFRKYKKLGFLIEKKLTIDPENKAETKLHNYEDLNHVFNAFSVAGRYGCRRPENQYPGGRQTRYYY